MSVSSIKIIYKINEYTSSNSSPISAGLILFILIAIIGYLYYSMIVRNALQSIYSILVS